MPDSPYSQSGLPATLARFVVRHRVAVLLANLLLLAALVRSIAAVSFETDVSIWFPPASPALAAYDQLNEEFGGDRLVFLAFEDPEEGVFSNRALAVVDQLTRGLEEHPLIDRVQSLTNFEVVRGVDGFLENIDPIDETALPLTEEELARARRLVLGEPLADGMIVDAEGKRTVVVGFMPPMGVAEDALLEAAQLSEHLYELEARAEARGYEVSVTGGPVIDAEMFVASLEDNARLFPLLYAVISVVLFGVVRRVGGVLYGLFVVGAATAGTVGGMVLAGQSFNNMTAMLPLILLAVSVANSVHVLVAFYGAERELGDRVEAAVLALARMLKPCFLTSVTTAIGFASLTISEMPPVRVYGATAAAGVLLSFAMSMTALPALLSFGRFEPRRARSRAGGDALDRLLGAGRRLATERPRAVVAAGLVLCVLAGLGVAMVRIETVALEFFRDSDPVRVATERTQELMGAVGNFELLIAGAEEGAAKDPAHLRQVETLQGFLDRIPEAAGAFSLVDVLKRIHRALNDDDARWDVIPESREAVAQLLLLYDLSDPSEDLSDLVDHERRDLRLFVRMPFLSSERAMQIVGEIERFRAQETPGLDVEITGLMVLYNSMGTLVFGTFVSSFSLALLVITVVIGLSLRSLPLGLLSMLPNVLPVFLVLGVMGYIGVPLNVGTALVAGITLGIAVDDTIHFLARYAEARAAGADEAGAIAYVFEHSGRAILATSVILTAGFFVLLPAAFVPMAHLGLIAGITIFFALVADLLLLPAVLTLIAGRSACAAGGARAGSAR